MTETHGKLKHDYITGSLHMDMIIWVLRKKTLTVSGNIDSGRPNLIMHPSVANL